MLVTFSIFPAGSIFYMMLIALWPSPNLNHILVLLIAFDVMTENESVVRLTRISVTLISFSELVLES